jgi:hypothetical protein
MSRQSRTQQEPSQNKWGQAAEAAQRGDQVSWKNDDRYNDSEWIEGETKRTQQDSLQSSRRAMQRLNDTQTMAEQNLNMLNSQSEQFNRMEKKLDEAGASAKTQVTKVDYLKSLNKYFFLPSFGGKKAKEAEELLNQKKETLDYGAKKHIKEREKQWEQRNQRVNRSNFENVNHNQKNYTTPDGLEEDDTEIEINSNMNNISSGLSRLKMMGICMSDELDSQNGQMDRISKRSEKTAQNVSKLNRKVNQIVDKK